MVSILLVSWAMAAEVAISPMSAFSFWDCPVGPFLVQAGVFSSNGATAMMLQDTDWGGCREMYIPLSPFILGRKITQLEVCYKTSNVNPGYGFLLSIIQTAEPGNDTILWSDPVARVSGAGQCDVIPLSITPTEAPVLKVDWEGDSDDTVTFGAITMKVTK